MSDSHLNSIEMDSLPDAGFVEGGRGPGCPTDVSCAYGDLFGRKGWGGPVLLSGFVSPVVVSDTMNSGSGMTLYGLQYIVLSSGQATLNGRPLLAGHPVLVTAPYGSGVEVHINQDNTTITRVYDTRGMM